MQIVLSLSHLCFLYLVVDEQNAHTEETELPSPLEFRKDSEEENRDSEKDEDTKELEAVPCECTTASASAAASALFPIFYLSGLVPVHICLALMHFHPGPFPKHPAWMISKSSTFPVGIVLSDCLLKYILLN